MNPFWLISSLILSLILLLLIISIKNKNKKVFLKYTNIEYISNLNNDDNDETCTICLERLDNNIIKLECTHIFHTYCINSWTFENINSKRRINSNCPICKRSYCHV